MIKKGVLAIAASVLYLVSAASGVSAAAIKPFKASYGAKASSIPVKGSATRELSLSKDGTYQLSFNADIVLVNLNESSAFTLDEKQQVKPISYHFRRGGLAKNKEISLKFDWNNKQAQNIADDNVKPFAIPSGTLDKISYQFQLRQDLINDKKELHYTIADDDELKTYKFNRVGEETIETPIGPVKAVKVERIREGDSDRQTLIWFAKDWDYLMVRLQQIEDSKRYDIFLKSASIEGQQLKTN
ncbi:DUF3108 domain-containing protein [Spartinivicinus poritis]|uniref:DUF3108 domain-containing protein n=1 Tax=Spartinivicinus poritis TaxID=2994640 RepID=A0ABT5UA06_9GAMM|nr:DUF3108 domain-containing protein [Spartinivicinus sp. A2-2]MDE1462387.1 DUF3108 domain-containing protein [Spartinivicinus sp. A2-2]